mmetsp:Transcript_12346/g.41141  ORF Transcript_12346/g.41141 Transcript_12346/m.41141 type:complete len:231 (-) Transcript_12346:43-735(-)
MPMMRSPPGSSVSDARWTRTSAGVSYTIAASPTRAFCVPMRVMMSAVTVRPLLEMTGVARVCEDLTRGMPLAAAWASESRRSQRSSPMASRDPSCAHVSSLPPGKNDVAAACARIALTSICSTVTISARDRRPVVKIMPPRRTTSPPIVRRMPRKNSAGYCRENSESTKLCHGASTARAAPGASTRAAAAAAPAWKPRRPIATGTTRSDAAAETSAAATSQRAMTSCVAS